MSKVFWHIDGRWSIRMGQIHSTNSSPLNGDRTKWQQWYFRRVSQDISNEWLCVCCVVHPSTVSLDDTGHFSNWFSHLSLHTDQTETNRTIRLTQDATVQWWGQLKRSKTKDHIECEGREKQWERWLIKCVMEYAMNKRHSSHLPNEMPLIGPNQRLRS